MDIRPDQLREARSFWPSHFSNSELEWLTQEETLGSAPAVIRSSPLPVGVNPNQVMPVIERIYEIEELDKAGHPLGEFVGVEKIRAGFAFYLKDVQSEEAQKRQNPLARRPKMGAFDLAGKFWRGMVGGDSDFVRTKWVKGKNGVPRKISYEIPLFAGEVGRAWVMEDEDNADNAVPLSAKDVGDFPVLGRFEVTIDTTTNVGSIRNPIDGHVENFKTGSQGEVVSIRSAWNRQRKHCLAAKSDVDSHMMLEKMIDSQMDEGV